MAKKSSSQKISPVKLIIGAVIVIALVASISLVKKNQENRSQARYIESSDGGATKKRVCTPGLISCDGNTSKICNTAGTKLTTLKNCAANQICKPVVGCVKNSNYKVCTPGLVSCDGNTSKLCNTAGTKLTTVKKCASNQICKSMVGCVKK